MLILKEPDLGSALVFLAISLAMMFVAGVPSRLLAGLVGGVGLLVVLVRGDDPVCAGQAQDHGILSERRAC